MLLLESLLNMKGQGLDLHTILGCMATIEQEDRMDSEERGVFQDSNFDELLRDFDWEIVEETEYAIIIKDAYTFVKVPKIDIPNRFSDDYVDETLYAFNEMTELENYEEEGE